MWLTLGTTAPCQNLTIRLLLSFPLNSPISPMNLRYEIPRILAVSWLMGCWRFSFWQLWGNNSGSALLQDFFWVSIITIRDAEPNLVEPLTKNMKSTSFMVLGPQYLVVYFLGGSATAMPRRGRCLFDSGSEDRVVKKKGFKFIWIFIVYSFRPGGWFAAFPRWARRRTISRQRQRAWCFDMSWLWLMFWLMF